MDVVIYERDLDGQSGLETGDVVRSALRSHVLLVSTTTRDWVGEIQGEVCLVKPIDFRELQRLIERTRSS